MDPTTTKAKDVMTRDVVSIDKDQRLETVLETMRKRRISKMVVVEKDKLAGVVTDGDIADELGAIKNRGVPAAQLHVSSAMRRKVPTVAPNTTVEACILDMLEHDTGLLPVAHDDTVVGVVTASDLVRLVESQARVETFMTAHVHAVAPSDRVIHARRVMLDHHVERLPVLDEGRLAGILGEIDIASGLARLKGTVADNHQAAALQRFLVEDVYQRTVVTTTPETTAKEAAQTMRAQDVGSLPVVRGGTLVGIITRSDLLKLLVA